TAGLLLPKQVPRESSTCGVDRSPWSAAVTGVTRTPSKSVGCRWFCYLGATSRHARGPRSELFRVKEGTGNVVTSAFAGQRWFGQSQEYRRVTAWFGRLLDQMLTTQAVDPVLELSRVGA